MSSVCMNCLDQPGIANVAGYWVCSDCELQAYLPPFMRGE